MSSYPVVSLAFELIIYTVRSLVKLSRLNQQIMSYTQIVQEHMPPLKTMRKPWKMQTKLLNSSQIGQKVGVGKDQLYTEMVI